MEPFTAVAGDANATAFRLPTTSTPPTGAPASVTEAVFPSGAPAVTAVWNRFDMDAATDDFYNSSIAVNWSASADDGDPTSTVEADPMLGYPYPSLYSWPHIIVASALVTVVMMAIVFGNALVVVAIAVDRGLRGLQNWFVASLAVSDLLVGLFIMPLTLTNELVGYWPFGDIVCELWLSTDVLLCTASILNLCLISLDRYWSIVRPITYVRSRTPRRAAAAISVVWALSIVICLPPVVGWKRPQPTKYGRYPLCVLSEEPGYIVYSITGSFYLPLIVMIAVYFKIYLALRDRARRNLKKKTAAAQYTRSALTDDRARTAATSSLNNANTGCRKSGVTSTTISAVVTSTGTGSHSDCQSASVSSPAIRVEPDSFADLNSEEDAIVVAVEREPEPEAVALNKSLSRATDEQRSDSERDQVVPFSGNGEERGFRNVCNKRTIVGGGGGNGKSRPKIEYHLVSGGEHPTGYDGIDEDDNDDNGGIVTTTIDRKYLSEPPTPEVSSGRRNDDADSRLSLLNSPPGSGISAGQMKSSGKASSQDRQHRRSLTDRGPGSLSPEIGGRIDLLRRHSAAIPAALRNYFRSASSATENSGDTTADGERGNGNHRNASVEPAIADTERTKRKLARARERRATLVLGIVMASFVGCWLPFFSIYPATALAGVAVPEPVFAVIFWLGYCNSALNPIIYTIFNRDFRAAFANILCSTRRLQAGGGGGGKTGGSRV